MNHQTKEALLEALAEIARWTASRRVKHAVDDFARLLLDELPDTSTRAEEHPRSEPASRPAQVDGDRSYGARAVPSLADDYDAQPPRRPDREAGYPPLTEARRPHLVAAAPAASAPDSEHERWTAEHCLNYPERAARAINELREDLARTPALLDLLRRYVESDERLLDIDTRERSSLYQAARTVVRRAQVMEGRPHERHAER